MDTKANRITTLWVRTSSRRYPVWFADGLLRRAGEMVLRIRPDCRRLFVISSPGVWALWGRELSRGLRATGVRAVPLLLDDREQAKRLAAVEPLAGELVRLGAERSCVLAALGGGVVGDITGFVAASYMRGVDYIQIPTTVVAHVDSAIGGKTGVNLAVGKNLLGAFFQPRAVLADPCTLFTLSPREYRAGLFEVVKSAVVGDVSLFRFLEKKMQQIAAGEIEEMRRALTAAARVKIRVVSRDEKEEGLRRILNFGHTFAHAWETLGSYRKLKHGEAVGWGMLAATLLSERMGRISGREAERISSLVASVGPLPRLPSSPPEIFWRQLQSDKKTRAGGVRFVLPRRIGRVEVVGDIPRREVLAAVRAIPGGNR